MIKDSRFQALTGSIAFWHFHRQTWEVYFHLKVMYTLCYYVSKFYTKPVELNNDDQNWFIWAFSQGFFFFLKKKRYSSTPSKFKSCLPIHTETLKWCKCDSDPSILTGCAPLYNVWHHRVRKTPFSFVHKQNEKPAFSKISTLQATLWNLHVLVPGKHRSCMDRTLR